jgi:outer membrane lipoprotein-sorting protein
MLRTRIGIAVAAGVLLGAIAASAQTAEELVEKNIRARGGLEKIKSVQSMRMTGTMGLGEETAPTVLEFKRPGRLRWEFTLDGQTAIQAFDGTAGWAILPFEGKTEPEKMPAEEVENFKRQADLDGPLVDYRAKGNRIELLGKGAPPERRRSGSPKRTATARTC